MPHAGPLSVAARRLDPASVLRVATVRAPTARRPRLLTLRKTLYWLCVLVSLYVLLVCWGMACAAWPHPRFHYRACLVGALLALMLTLATARALFRAIQTDVAGRRGFAFSHVLAGFVMVSLALLLRGGGRVAAPAWPARALRPAPVVSNQPALRSLPADAASYFAYNSWGMRDLERSIQKPAGKFRAVCIGDSFLEGGFCSFPLPLLTERLLVERGGEDIECLNLGVSGTDPESYYHRLRRVGLHLQPDAVLVFLYAGNDYLDTDQKFCMDGRQLLTRGIDELPKPSLLGQYFPEFTWLVWNRWHFAAPARHQPVGRDEFSLILEWTALPFEDGVCRLARHMQENHFPQHTHEEIEAVLTRGGPRFWAELQDRDRDREYLHGWLLTNLLSVELRRAWYAKTPTDFEPVRLARRVAATASWLTGMQELCQAAGVPMLVVLCPAGGVDPDYMDYWAPWPAFRAKNFLFEARHAEMTRQLQRNGVDHLDLADALRGERRTYRKTDAHWNERGHRLVAERLAAAIQDLRQRTR
ncbi:MAG: SGNH/GDSL hydrolase family protein [Planctomycetia bacterium]|nr:SGNH/GDSL hydrolase family protein [Planctomycetia bacterium]